MHPTHAAELTTALEVAIYGQECRVRKYGVAVGPEYLEHFTPPDARARWDLTRKHLIKMHWDISLDDELSDDLSTGSEAQSCDDDGAEKNGEASNVASASSKTDNGNPTGSKKRPQTQTESEAGLSSDESQEDDAAIKQSVKKRRVVEN